MTMNHIPSYPSVYAVGHRAISDLLKDPVLVEEKVDGSQFSMSRTGGELSCRSKGKDLIIDAPEKMFTKAVETARSLDLHDGWTYRCEYLQSPKHNTLAYSRVPAQHLIVFDICTGLETYLQRAEKEIESARIGLECVPVIYHGFLDSMQTLNAMLSRESILGGCAIEGVVIKNYIRFTVDKKAMIGKYVSEAFKEKHQGDWKERNPAPADMIAALTASLRTEARWAKAVQHLREAGEDVETPKVIGKVIAEVQADIEKEESEAIREALYCHFWPQIRRGAIAGLPEWFKKQLTATAFQQ